jgi:hypothetical protein
MVVKEVRGPLFEVTSFQVPSAGTSEVTVDVAFTPIPLERGRIVLAECYLGCTGVRVRLESTHGEFTEYTSGTGFDVAVDSRGSSEERRWVSTSALSMKLGNAGVGLDASQAPVTVDSASFKNVECCLVATRISPTCLHWSYALHRSMKVVRDYLEGNLRFIACCHWNEEPCPQFTCSVQATDRRFYGPTRRPLSSLKSLALFLKLKNAGFDLPSVGPVVHHVLEREDVSMQQVEGES